MIRHRFFCKALPHFSPAGPVCLLAAILFFPQTPAAGAERKIEDLPPGHPAVSPKQAQKSGKTTKAVPGATTTDTSSLSLTRNIMFIKLEKGFYHIREVFQFQNFGQATILSKDGAPTIRLTLPRSNNIRNPAAQMVNAPQGLDQNRVRRDGDQILSDEPIPPGAKLVGLDYRLADEFGGIMVEKPVAYGSSSFAILPEKDRVQLGMVDNLNRGDPVKFQDREYESFVGTTRAGSTIRFHLKAPDSLGGLWYFYAVGGGLFVLGAFLALAIRGRRKKGLMVRVEREELLRSLAALDDRQARGEISPDEHFQQRAPRFERLRKISR